MAAPVPVRVDLNTVSAGTYERAETIVGGGWVAAMSSSVAAKPRPVVLGSFARRATLHSMTTPSGGHVRLVTSGTVSGSQTWSTGVSVAAGANTLTQSQLDGLLAAYAAAWQANLWGSGTTPLKGANAAVVDLRSFRAYWYPFGNPPVALQSGIDIAPIAGNSGSGFHPPQCALVVTLLTGIPGRKYRGRMYLPATGLAVQSDLQVSTAALTPIAAGVKATFDAVNTYTTTNGPGDVAVAGSAGPVPLSAIRIDSELDIQRRRADKILGLRQVTQNLA